MKYHISAVHELKLLQIFTECRGSRRGGLLDLHSQQFQVSLVDGPLDVHRRGDEGR